MTVRIKINEEILAKLEIVNKLRQLNNILDCSTEYDIEVLAARLVCNPILLVEVLDTLGCAIIE